MGFIEDFGLPIAAILIILGLFYVGLPHSLHQDVSPDWIIANIQTEETGVVVVGFTHDIHQGYGAILLIIAAIILFLRFR